MYYWLNQQLETRGRCGVGDELTNLDHDQVTNSKA